MKKSELKQIIREEIQLLYEAEYPKMSQNSKEIADMFKKNVDGYYLMNAQKKKWVLYNLKYDDPLYNYLEKKFGKFRQGSGGNADEWNNFYVDQIKNGKVVDHPWVVKKK